MIPEFLKLEWFHPGLLLILGAWVVPLLKGRAKQVVMVLLPTVALVICLRMSSATYGMLPFLGARKSAV